MPLRLPSIPPLDRNALELARARQDSLTKPRGSLGRLEDIACAVAGMQGDALPSFARRVIVVAAADHGVVAEGVSAYPSEVTAQMVRNFLSGGAAINVLARQGKAEVVVVDAGVAGKLPDDDRLVRVALSRGTRNMARGPAMPCAHAEEIVARGIKLGASLAERGRVAVVPGDMGIGNTTASAAITAVMTGKSAGEVAGPGTG
jgi:nicotinate-nucleotide--dimethylbenzimidazole phosphoribosyltransferase